MPNSSWISKSLALIARRRGQWDQGEVSPERTDRLDPRNVELLYDHAFSYIFLRRFPEALRKLDQILDITPDDLDTLVAKAVIAQAENDLPRAAGYSLHCIRMRTTTKRWKHKFTKRSWSGALHKSSLGCRKYWLSLIQR